MLRTISRVSFATVTILVLATPDAANRIARRRAEEE
jgi:hypothetical protein